jgi:ABC-type lipoprotein release transport system permease subunit
VTRLALVWRSLWHYRRTNLAVTLGVATAVSVLAGALLVGESVRASLRALAVQRLGATDVAVTAPGYVREALADEVTAAAAAPDAAPGPIAAAAPLIVGEGVVEHAASGRRSARVAVYGVDDRFWRFHALDGRVEGPTGRQAFLSAPLARELDAAADDTLVLALERPSAIPRAALQGRRDASITTVRLTVARTLAGEELGEFSLRPSQGDVRAVFVPLSRLQTDLARRSLVNALVLSMTDPRPAGDPEAGARAVDAVERRLAASVGLDDLGVRMRKAPDEVRGERSGALVVERTTGLLADDMAADVRVIADEAGYEPVPVLTYLANTLRAGDREVPYSMVSALDRPALEALMDAGSRRMRAAWLHPPIWFGAWAFAELAPRFGDTITLDYFLWSDDEGLSEHTASFSFAGTVAAPPDATLTPDYPGLTDQVRMAEWDPPFPVDLGRVRRVDEDYWNEHRAAPKAFVLLDEGQRLWSSRYGRLSSMRLAPRAGADPPAPEALARALGGRLDPFAAGTLLVAPVRVEQLAAAAGTTDFGEYFLYFSFFLVVSALLLAGLFFRLGLEQRLREIGLLAAVGLPARAVFTAFALEGLVLAVTGAALGVLGALGYASLVMLGLRTWWVEAVGTTALVLQPSFGPLAIGVAGGVAAAFLALALGLRTLSRTSTRALLAGALPDEAGAPAAARARRRLAWTTAGLAAAALALVAVASTGRLSPVAAFFGAGSALLGALVTALAWQLRRQPRSAIVPGPGALARLGGRASTARPGRATLCVTLIAAATFIIVAVTAFRRDATDPSTDPRSGTGGYAVIVETMVPVMHDPATPAGRDALDLADLPDLSRSVARFRLRPGDDASCLNLYRPTSPRVLGVPDSFIDQGRFRFGSTLAATADERTNPWRLLRRTFDDGAIPAVVDANSLTYVLHLGVGDDLVVSRPSGEPIRFRVVGALADTLFQSEVVVAEAEFLRIFPDVEGYRVFLAGEGQPAKIETAIEQRWADYGADARSAADYLASFHRVENTYLSTFQTLGGLGLVLGTLGLGLVIARNVLERQRELGLLRAVGFEPGALRFMVVAETLLLVASGLVVGVVSALVAITPAFVERGQPLPLGTLSLLVVGVGLSGVLASAAAARLVGRLPLVAALRSE